MLYPIFNHKNSITPTPQVVKVQDHLSAPLEGFPMVPRAHSQLPYQFFLMFLELSGMKILKIHKLQPYRSKHYKITSNAPYSSKPFRQYPPNKQNTTNQNYLVPSGTLRFKLRFWPFRRTSIPKYLPSLIVRICKILHTKPMHPSW